MPSFALDVAVMTDGKKEKALKRSPEGPRVAVAQMAPLLGDLEQNLEMHRRAVARAEALGADLLVFPELSLTGYRLKDTVPDVALARSSELVAELAGLSASLALVVGLVEETPGHHFHNASVYFEKGRLAALHRKVYLPTYGMFDEQRYFARGLRIGAFDSAVGRAAMLLCEDMLHPTALTIAALDGATVLIVPSASPVKGIVGDGEVDANGRHWEAYNRTMARNAGLYVVYANRVGVEDGITFWGGSEIIGPAGETLAKAAYYEDDLISAVVTDAAVRRRRIHSPVLRDEDLDLTINELSRLRGRPRQPLPEGREPLGPSARRGRPGDDDGPRRRPRLKPERGERRRRKIEPGLALAEDKVSGGEANDGGKKT